MGLMTSVHKLPDKWWTVSIAPQNVDLEVCVMDRHEVHALVFPVRKSGDTWLDASTRARVDVEPTHWRVWTDTTTAP